MKERYRLLMTESINPPSSPESPSSTGGLPSTSTAILEREEQKIQEPGDNERYAHYVRKDKIMRSALEGSPVVALCGKVWTPGRDPSAFPVCPVCKEIYDELKQGEGDKSGKPWWPFGNK